ncbi:zinc finger protein castor homolog 1-like isoform X2 [Liolophura sinensis]|uniref:zinc finger protein castor homolog 1-like isoform X2 n=1 Tax=Liolophura sinensis TaxID=3198878 RepID=UPI0031592EA2
MAMSVGKLGKLDAICARLQKTQGDLDQNGWPGTFHGLDKSIEDPENNNVPITLKTLGKVSSSPTSSTKSPPTGSQGTVTTVKHASGRRKNRKAAVPRNLTQVNDYLEQFAEEKDELLDYKINNQDTDFPPQDSRSNENSEDEIRSNEQDDQEDSNDAFTTKQASEATINAKDDKNNNSDAPESSNVACPKTTQLGDVKTVDQETEDGVLDLSVSKVTNGNSAKKTKPLACTDPRPVENGETKTDDEEDKNHHPVTEKTGDVDVAGLKSYAERTMNEFLSMYGFPGDLSDTMPGQIPLHSFSLGKMLHPRNVDTSRPSVAPLVPHSIPMGSALHSLTSQTPVSLPASNGHSIHPIALTNGSKFNHLAEDYKVALRSSIDASISSPSNAVLSSVISPSVNRVPPSSGQQTDLLVSTVTSPSKLVLPDYSKYIRRFNSAQECQRAQCRDMGYREHFHCLDCNFKVFVRKEEMIRHFKWHKKRDDSLQHGFMRYSPMDDCSKEFGVCTHNGRQTHYHCLQSGCDKVYISTSDVQMHANYHRKDSAIIQEGFQRFRATEDCGTPSCSFYGQRTTHFHCRRQDCKFTFKNKADMEKHKSYHQKDEILGRDGFKKFMKYEHCPFSSCRFSKISNHIHCIRPGCDYVLHSTGQLYSHKRKHERRDFESAYRRFKENQKTRPVGVSSKPEPSVHPAFGTVTHVPVSRIANFQPITTLAQSIPHLPANGRAVTSEQPVMQDTEYGDLEDTSRLYASGETTPSGSMSPASMATSTQSEMRTDVTMTVKTESEDMEEGSQEALEGGPRSLGLAAYSEEISGDQLNDSLTLPIPKYTETSTTDTPQISPQITYTPNQSPPKTPLPQVASGLSTPVITPTLTMSTPSTPSVHLGVPTPRRDWPTRLAISMEKRPKDESWKAYIIRYTANDPCNSRCQYLYKDHYHCKVDNCTVLFKSKDAVREHARYHELQERITAMAYNTYEKLQACPHECDYSLREKHYHCIWAGCHHVIQDSGPIFSRLEHYRIHEYARVSAGKSNKLHESPDFGKRRRGRPPKYPRAEIPVVPKVELSEEELNTLNRSGMGNHGRLVSSFKRFEDNQPCPDELCLYYFKAHFHCARPRCHHATDREDVLNLHTKDFHSFVDIMEGFEFFDRNVNCRRPQCHNNKANRHFHCVRPRCDYSFVRHTTMAQHDKKHTPDDVEDSFMKLQPMMKRDYPNFVPIAPAPGWRPKTVVKAAGTFYPISTINNGLLPQRQSLSGSTGPPMPAPLVSHMTSNTVNSAQITYPATATNLSQAVPLTMLLQQKPGNHIQLPTWSTLRSQMHYAIQQNCARPFCKLKKKDHYHCLECNQAFSDPARLRSHIGKHGIKLERVDSGMRVQRSIAIAPKQSFNAEAELPEDLSVHSAEPENLSLSGSQHDNDSQRDSESHQDSESHSEDEPEDLSTKKGEVTTSASLNLTPDALSNILAKDQGMRDYYGHLDDLSEDNSNSAPSTSQWKDSDDDCSADDLVRSGYSAAATGNPGEPSSRRSGRKRSAYKMDDFVNSDSMGAKQQRLSSPSSGREEELFMPEGYQKFKFTEDCGFETCVYRRSITHYHCQRADCGYSFCNRTRVIQHSQRHERIDGITGNEFRQFRGNVDCQYEDCEYGNRSSHFHCLLCSYVCMDAAQVLAHRKHHQKMRKIMAQGFQKFSGSEDCKILTCTYYYKKQTHYHCTESGCNFVVLSPSQMATHKMKHIRENR